MMRQLLCLLQDLIIGCAIIGCARDAECLLIGGGVRQIGTIVALS